MIDLKTYQQLAKEYDTFEPSRNPRNPAMIDKVLGLVGEAGEVADKIKKNNRDKDGDLRTYDYFEVALELGDVLWYLTQLSRYLGFTLEDIAEMNIMKLQQRLENGTIHGSGDYR